METGNWPYALILEGEHIFPLQSEPMKLREERHFLTLKDAFESLIRESLDKFNGNVPLSAEYNTRWERCSILDIQSGTSKMEVVTISMEDSPEAEPPAGLYLNFEDEVEMGAFQRLTGNSFKDFSLFDPDMPMLCIARLYYTSDGIILKPDPAWESLTAYVRGGVRNNTPWNYQLVEDKIYNYSDPARQVTTFHFETFKDAFSFLIHDNLLPVDELLNLIKYKLEERNEIGIYDIEQRLQLGVVSIRDKRVVKEDVTEGIYLYVPENAQPSVRSLINNIGLDGNAEFKLWKRFDFPGVSASSVDQAEQVKNEFKFIASSRQYPELRDLQIKSVFTSLDGQDIEKIELGRSLSAAINHVMTVPEHQFKKPVMPANATSKWLKSVCIYEKGKPVLERLGECSPDGTSVEIGFRIFPETISVELLALIMPRLPECGAGQQQWINLSLTGGTIPQDKANMKRQRDIVPDIKDGHKPKP